MDVIFETDGMKNVLTLNNLGEDVLCIKSVMEKG